MTVKPIVADRIMDMKEAQDYLVAHDVPVKSRSTFYRLIEDYSIPYVDLTPSSRYSNRRFHLKDLDKFLETIGFTQEPNQSRDHLALATLKDASTDSQPIL